MIDLKALAGDRYRITLDESAKGEPRSGRVWYYQIPGKYGHVWVHGAGMLAAYCHARLVRHRLMAVPGVRMLQNGDRECSIAFPPDQLDAIATILQCRKRRILTDAQRERLSAVAAKGRERSPICRSKTEAPGP